MRQQPLRLYLNSSSPQRLRLLRTFRIEFELLDCLIDETTHEYESADEYVHRMAISKAQAGAKRLEMQRSQRFCVIGADTCVVLGDEIFGKPQSRTEAAEMLGRLSGQTHSVLSSVAIRCSGSDIVWSELCTTHVRFDHLTKHQIETFVNSGEANNRAGAYGIQGKAGDFITQLDGTWSSVVGLPIKPTMNLLNKRCLFSVDYESAVSAAMQEFAQIPTFNGTYQI